MSARTGDSVKTVVPKSFMANTRIELELGGANRHQSSVGNVSGLASCQVWEAGSGHCGESNKHLRKFRVGTLNVNTLRGRVCEVVETLSRRKVDVCCIQETRYRSGNCRSQWQGHQVQALLVRKWQRHCRCRSVCGRRMDRESFWGSENLRQNYHSLPACGYLPVCALQSGLSDEVKDLFFDQLRAVTARIPASEFLIPCGDWNGHVGHAGTGYKEVHGAKGYGRPEPDVKGERILEYALAFDLLLGNTCFKKRDSHITYKSGNTATQIDFILFRRTMRKLVTDV